MVSDAFIYLEFLNAQILSINNALTEYFILEHIFEILHVLDLLLKVGLNQNFLNVEFTRIQ